MVSPQTAQKVIGAGTEILRAAAEELFVRSREQEILETQAQFDQELARLQSSSSPTVGSTDIQGTGEQLQQVSLADRVEQATEAAERMSESLAQLKQIEECVVCAPIVNEVRDRPLDEQRSILPDLLQLIRAVENGADAQQQQSIVNSSETLSRLYNPESVTSYERRQGPPESDDQATTESSGGGVDAEIEDLMDGETCGTCRSILSALKEAPPDKKKRGVEEYKKLKRMMDEEADKEEIQAFIFDESDVLSQMIS